MPRFAGVGQFCCPQRACVDLLGAPSETAGVQMLNLSAVVNNKRLYGWLLLFN